MSQLNHYFIYVSFCGSGASVVWWILSIACSRDQPVSNPMWDVFVPFFSTSFFSFGVIAFDEGERFLIVT